MSTPPSSIEEAAEPRKHVKACTWGTATVRCPCGYQWDAYTECIEEMTGQRIFTAPVPRCYHHEEDPPPIPTLVEYRPEGTL